MHVYEVYMYTCECAFVLWDVVCLSMSSVMYLPCCARVKDPSHLRIVVAARRPSGATAPRLGLFVLPSNAGRRPSGAKAPRLGFLLYYRVRVGEGVKNSAAGKGVLGPRSLENSGCRPQAQRRDSAKIRVVCIALECRPQAQRRDSAKIRVLVALQG